MDSTASPRTSLRPLAELSEARAEAVRVVATDVDGTLTQQGRLSSALLAAFESLAHAGVEIIPVSGRPAGEVLALCRYLPGVSRGIAENGMVQVWPDAPAKLLADPRGKQSVMDALGNLTHALARPLRPAPDAFCRLADVAFERDGRDFAELHRIRRAARAVGLHCVWSNVHVHLSVVAPDKGKGLAKILAESQLPANAVATIGDAPNDVGMFASDRFGVTVGTGQIRALREELLVLPEFVTDGDEVAGFVELANAILAALS